MVNLFCKVLALQCLFFQNYMEETSARATPSNAGEELFLLKVLFCFPTADLLFLKKQGLVSLFCNVWPSGIILLQNYKEETSARATPSDGEEDLPFEKVNFDFNFHLNLFCFLLRVNIHTKIQSKMK